MKRKMMAILLVITMLISLIDPGMLIGMTAKAAGAETKVQSGYDESTNTYYIGSIADFQFITEQCKDGTSKYLSANYILLNDIELTEEMHNNVNIGTSQNHFRGTFDGQGHKITGLWGDAQVALNNGLFGVMDGATVKNLVIENADIRSNQYGGILAAQAINSVIQNVTIINSKCKVASLGAVVGLITTGGLYGGALVGYAGNTKIYNCESRNTQVWVDTTGGVQALGGDGMYMGGLVGWIDNGSILEYSRVVGGAVSTEYYVAVGALAANNVYAGGLVGRLDGDKDYDTCKILDCFSNANVNYKGECYVSVGAGLSGYAGGIAARVSGSNYEIARCHYAGNIHGFLLNSILVLPIVPMYDYYLGGITGKVENYNSNKIHNCYFDWEKAVAGNKHPSKPKLPAVYGESNTGDVTAIGDAQYSNPTFFLNYDFTGIADKETGNAAPFDGKHANKWVIDPINNMPVHGNMVQAEIDFPQAGTIKLGVTSIHEEQSTTEGSISQIAQTHAEMNEEIILTATVNEGYNFTGWYLKGTEIEVPSTAEEKDGVVYHTVMLGGDSDARYDYKDGDVFEARYTANVVFKNTDGSDFAIEQCTYKQVLNPNEKSPTAPGYIHLGWSDTELTGEFDKDHLTSEALKNQTVQLQPDNMVIEKAMVLYPVFIAIGNYNVRVQVQSAPFVGDSTYIKEATGAEGTAKVLTDVTGTPYITIVSEDANGNKLEGKEEKDGYRFDGWYEIDANGDAKLISKSKTYSLKNIDLSTQHRYEARYQYRVRAYVPVKDNTAEYLEYDEENGYIGGYYVSYGTVINDENSKPIPDPQLNPDEVIFTYWGDKNLGVINWNKIKEEATKEPLKITVTNPLKIYALIYRNGTGNYHAIAANTDFPAGTAEIKVTDYKTSAIQNGGSISVDLQIKEGYNFKGFWQYYIARLNGTWKTMEQINTLDCVGKIGSWTTQHGPYYAGDSRLLARVTANIVLYQDKDHPETATTITRKYNSRIFNYTSDGTYYGTEDWDTNSDKTATPVYNVTDEVINPIGTGETLCDADMQKPGYKFLGWTVDKEIFDVDDDAFVTTDLSNVGAYLLDPDTRVTETMTLYPVYVKYDVSTRTSFDRTDADLRPAQPTYTVQDDGTLTLTLGSANNANVSERYELKDWIVSIDGNVTNVTPEKNADGTYSIQIDYAKRYEFVAVYETKVSFKDGTTSNDKMYEYGDNLDTLPVSQHKVNENEVSIKPGESFTGNEKVFVGWKDYPVTETPEKETIDVSTEELGTYSFVSEDKKVEYAMDLLPVYSNPQITLKSNITTGDSVPRVIISQEGSVTLDAPEVSGYQFKGWVRDDGKEISEPHVVISPEDLREAHTYEVIYDPIITYMIPSIDEDGTVTYEESIKSSIPYGGTIEENPNIDAVNRIIRAVDQTSETEIVFTGDWMDEDGTIINQETIITKPITLRPVVKEARRVTIYSNLNDGDTSTSVPMILEDDKVTFSEESSLNMSAAEEELKGIENTPIETQFIGYSLVTIEADGTHKSQGLYAAGDTIDQEKLLEYSNENDETKRIYAVWAQVQTLTGARIYVGPQTNGWKFGLLVGAGVNTEILRNAGLQNGDVCDYKRGMMFAQESGLFKVNNSDSNYSDIFTLEKYDKTVNGYSDNHTWDTSVYKEYFNPDCTKLDAGTWGVYTSTLSGIKQSLYRSPFAFRSYLTFTYANNTTKTIYGTFDNTSIRNNGTVTNKDTTSSANIRNFYAAAQDTLNKENINFTLTDGQKQKLETIQ